MRGHYGAILADPAWAFEAWSKLGNGRSAERHYATMSGDEIKALGIALRQAQDEEAVPVGELAAADCALFLWATWPTLPLAIEVIAAWGFKYKACAFVWVKAAGLRRFMGTPHAAFGGGFWTRANTEPCLLATRGAPKRLNRDVGQVIAAPRRQHSRKPDEIYRLIERLVGGPYLELFSQTDVDGWTAWGDQMGKYGRLAR